MIYLFRKVRHHLLQNNRVTKYLLYAVGEILLVVIGILLALHVNNWNEEQSDRHLRNQYRQALRLDLRKDQESRQKSLENFKQGLQVQIRLIEKFRDPAVSKDSLYQLIKSFDPAFYRVPETNRNTFTALISSGNISLFNTTLADAIISYYSSSDSFEKDMDNQLNFYYQMFANFMTEIPFTQGANQTGPIAELWESVDMDKASILVTGYASLKTFNYRRSLEGLEKQIESAGALIGLLDRPE